MVNNKNFLGKWALTATFIEISTISNDVIAIQRKNWILLSSKTKSVGYFVLEIIKVK